MAPPMHEAWQHLTSLESAVTRFGKTPALDKWWEAPARFHGVLLHGSETAFSLNHALPAGNLPREGTGEPLTEVEEDQGTGLKSDSIPLSMFSCPGAAGFKVRGPNYLQDKKKVVFFWLCHACSA